MKMNFKLVGGFCVVTLLGGFHTALAQQTLTVSPAITSNTYPGLITLNITGLTNLETVTVQEWLDLNSNGVIDAGEPMIDAGKITDNDPSKAIIGGVTNINIPIDSNSATGAITTTLDFAPPMVLENVIGQRIFRLVSPSGRFAPVTATLLVTNAVTAQTLSGTVYSNGVTPLPNAVVVVLPPNGNGYTAAEVADSNGHYSINVNPGSYVVMAAVPDYFIDQSLAPQVTLTNGQSATNNLFLTNGTTTISGTFYDTANSNGIGGLMIQLQSGSLFGIGFTDTNGNYSAAVTPNFWQIGPNKERMPRHGYVVPQQSLQVDATGGNVTNVYVGLTKGNALFYGHIADNLGNPFANIEFDSSATNNTYDAKGYSDTNGNYAALALADGTNIWNCNPNNENNIPLAGYILNNSQNTNIAVSQAIEQDFVALPINAQISGRVRDNSGNPVVGVSLYAGNFTQQQRLCVLEFADRHQRRLLARRRHQRRPLECELQLRRPERPASSGPRGPLRAIPRFLSAHQCHPEHHRLSLRFLGHHPAAAVRLAAIRFQCRRLRRRQLHPAGLDQPGLDQLGVALHLPAHQQPDVGDGLHGHQRPAFLPPAEELAPRNNRQGARRTKQHFWPQIGTDETQIKHL